MKRPKFNDAKEAEQHLLNLGGKRVEWIKPASRYERFAYVFLTKRQGRGFKTFQIGKL